MTKRLSSKHKIDRRLGLNLWGRPKSPFNRRPYGPGQHGQARKRKLSDFGVQLAAKQKLKKYYGLLSQHRGLKVEFEKEDSRCRTHTCVELLSECNYVIEDSKENIDRIHKEILDYLCFLYCHKTYLEQ